ncbi:hypothetical protein N7509_012309 [Penicillium cosmopolitanum]|uniref:Uncharacterized protein n=1 Tax=Penicillium cosmopolitanum TaxID=1131564 RepID=A0A9W9SIT3_9EURO|nr:uncharacterized protein N7509_012309 [Penicillium cosmopolitanum]KAJ5379190.1 hypothetical protein N7509_012309 [Penicillium cosmopolitanum]
MADATLEHIYFNPIHCKAQFSLHLTYGPYTISYAESSHPIYTLVWSGYLSSTDRGRNSLRSRWEMESESDYAGPTELALVILN